MFSENLKRIRTERGLKQRELADLLHVGKSTISCYETGRIEPALNTLVMMRKVLKCSYKELLE